jgi:cbb3-type cytochrome oxidase maturation protein
MSVILILMLASLAVALAFLAGFIWAVRAGQFEDTCTPAMRILSEDDEVEPCSPNVRAVRCVARQAGVRPAGGEALQS